MWEVWEQTEPLVQSWMGWDDLTKGTAFEWALEHNTHEWGMGEGQRTEGCEWDVCSLMAFPPPSSSVVAV